ncbi:MAG: endonuclease/exonuclease/phosphatase family protein, partial [Bdellovibrionales bacterium]|nr:endonuclease/exonuclease/phosphatase family protein [Bdellovibrionales bacterium]
PARDLAQLCHHSCSGDLLILGWNPAAQPLTFPIERGAHAGPGVNETHAFLLIPGMRKFASTGEVLRLQHVYRGGMEFLGRTVAGPERPRNVTSRGAQEGFRVMTYNVHGCRGLDGHVSPKRVAGLIARHDPDVVCLQEVDVGRSRSEFRDQAHAIASLLEMTLHFEPSFQVEDERYGNAILSRLPMRLVKTGRLPSVAGRSRREPRSVIWVAIQVGDREVHCLNTHFGITGSERTLQARALLGPDWLGSPECAGPVILCGDLNATPFSRVYRLLERTLTEGKADSESRRSSGTWVSFFPFLRLDHILVNRELRTSAVRVVNSRGARTASDHLPVIADVELAAGVVADDLPSEAA